MRGDERQGQRHAHSVHHAALVQAVHDDIAAGAEARCVGKPAVVREVLGRFVGCLGTSGPASYLSIYIRTHPA